MLSMSRHMRLLALVALVAFAAGALLNTACSTWRWAELEPNDDIENHVGERVRLHLDNEEVVDFIFEAYEPPFLIGFTMEQYGGKWRRIESRIHKDSIIKLETQQEPSLRYRLVGL